MICSAGATGDGVREDELFSEGEREKLSSSSSGTTRWWSGSGAPWPELGSRVIIMLASVGVMATGGPCACGGSVYPVPIGAGGASRGIPFPGRPLPRPSPASFFLFRTGAAVICFGAGGGEPSPGTISSRGRRTSNTWYCCASSMPRATGIHVPTSEACDQS